MIDGYLRFLRKELAEIVRTWRLPVLAGIVLFFALTGPLTALFTPALLKSMQASQPGVIIQLPEPIWRDAYAQWIKNLSQIVSFVVIIVAAGSVAGEVSSGTALLVLTKPVSRKAFVLAKATALAALLGFVTIVGTALTQIETLVIFHRAPAAELWLPTMSWLLFAIVLIAVMAFVAYSWFINTAAMIPDLFHENVVGSVMGFLGTAGSAGGVLFSMLVGYVLSRHSYGVMFVIAGSMHVVAAIILWAFLKPAPAQSATPAIAAT